MSIQAKILYHNDYSYRLIKSYIEKINTTSNQMLECLKLKGQYFLIITDGNFDEIELNRINHNIISQNHVYRLLFKLNNVLDFGLSMPFVENVPVSDFKPLCYRILDNNYICRNHVGIDYIKIVSNYKGIDDITTVHPKTVEEFEYFVSEYLQNSDFDIAKIIEVSININNPSKIKINRFGEVYYTNNNNDYEQHKQILEYTINTLRF